MSEQEFIVSGGVTCRRAELLPAVKTNEAGTVVENRKYVYNESNQLSEAVLCDGKTTRKVQYTYDADGNLTGEYSPTDRSLTTYTYTVENRLEAVYTGTAYSQTLQMAAAYDGDGNRVYQLNYNPDKDEDLSDYYCTNNPCDYKGTGIRLRVEGEVSPAERELLSRINASGAVTDSSYELIEYINDVNREYTEVLVEQNINGTTDTAYVYGAAIGIGSDRLSLDRFDSSTGYYLYDPKGSVTGIINEEGQIYQSYRYSVFGEITFGASEYENEYTYNGESYNPNIKSQYLRARYYCVVTADFLTEDSYLGNIREPLTLNRYNYCVGNPVNYADPSGNTYFGIPEMHADWLIWHEGMLLPWEPGESYQEYRKRVARQADMEYKIGIFNGVMEPIVDVVKYPYALGEDFLSLFSNKFNRYEIALDRIERKKEKYLERCKELAVYKTDYYAGKCVGNVFAFAADAYLTWSGLVKSGEAISNAGGPEQSHNLVRVNGGYDTVVLVNSTALAGVAEGSLGAAAGILLSQGAWSNLQENLGKIDMDRLLGNKGGSSRIRPSNPYDANAKPSGTPTRIADNLDDATRRSLMRENETAEVLARNGYNIEQNPVVEGTTRNPDYRIEGEIFDCYSPEGNTKVRNIWSTVEEKVVFKQQADNIVLNLDDWLGNLDDLIKQFKDYSIEGLKEIIAVQDGRVFSIYP